MVLLLDRRDALGQVSSGFRRSDRLAVLVEQAQPANTAGFGSDCREHVPIVRPTTDNARPRLTYRWYVALSNQYATAPT